VWSLGATVDKNGRDKFDAEFREMMTGKDEENPIPAEVGKIECPIPPDGLVYDYLFEVSMWICSSDEFLSLEAVISYMLLTFY